MGPAAGGRSGASAFWAGALFGAMCGAMCGCASTPGSRVEGASALETSTGHTPGRQPRALRSTEAVAWQFHPRRMRRARSIGTGGGRFWLDGRGLRFWRAPGEAVARASRTRAVAALRAVSKAPGGWSFLTDRGDHYLAKTPLGALRHIQTAPEPVFLAQRWGRGFLGVSRSGLLVQGAILGGAWRPVATAAGRFAALVAQPEGPALALSVPEGVWQSAGPGHGWQQLESEPVGAFALVNDAVEGPLVVSALGSFRPSQEGLQAIAHRPVARQTDEDLVRGPSAKALERGEAQLSPQGRYIEVVTAPRPGFYVGQLGQPLAWLDQPALQPCREARVGAYGPWTWVVCTREGSGATRIFQLFVGHGNEQIEATSLQARGHLDQLQLAAGANGHLAIGGLCLPSRQVARCEAQGLRLARARAPDASRPRAASWRPLNAPTLRGSVHFLAFSPDGGQLFAGGRSHKSHPLTVLRSAKDLRLEPVRGVGQTLGRDSGRLRPLGFGEDSTLSVWMQPETGSGRLLQLSTEGPIQRAGEVPGQTSHVAGAGHKALALSDGVILETLDGGRHWQPAEPPSALDCQVDPATCPSRLWCSAAGCVVDESFSRLGWGQQQASEDSPLEARLAPAPRAADSSPPQEAQPNFSCVATDAGWRPLQGAHAPPNAASAALGDCDWFALAFDDDKASVSLWTATQGQPPERDFLLAPHSEPSRVAYLPSLQMEGAAALRYRIPEEGPLGALHDVEVSWRDLLRGRSRSAHIRQAGRLRPGDYRPTPSRAQRAQADLLSISSAGLYARVHRASKQAQPTYFLQGPRQAPVPLPSPRFPAKGRSDMLTIAGQHYGLLTVQEGAVVLRHGPLGAPNMELRAAAVGLAAPGQFELKQHIRVAYASAGPGGLSVQRFGEATRESSFFPFAESSGRIFNPPIPMPTADMLGRSIAPCPRNRRASGMRVIARMQPRTASTATVWDSIDGRRELTGHAAVLLGPPEGPCLAALEARLTQPQRSFRLLINPLPGASSWLFRAPIPRRADTPVAVRQVWCRASAPIERR